MTGFRDQGARRHSRHYVEHSDRVKAGQSVLLGRRSRGLVQHAGLQVAGDAKTNLRAVQFGMGRQARCGPGLVR